MELGEEELELGGADEELLDEVLESVAVEAAPGVPESQEAVVVRASAASPVRRTRAWRAG